MGNQQPLFEQQTEKGAACMTVTLSGGEIIVSHGVDGNILYRANLNVGGWSAIWAAIHSNSHHITEENRRVQD